MISRISISGFSLLRDVTVELGPGLTVLTGESGAGKSLLFDAVAFAMGGRPHRSLLAAGVKRCEVELQLKLTVAAAGILGTPWVSGTNCLVRRYTAAGRSRIQANGEQISVADAQAVGERIFEITGQFESRMLFNPDSHLALLEAFASDELAGLLSDYHTAYRRWRGVCTRLAARQASSSQRKQELDYLQFQVAELGDAAIEVGERSTVEAELTVLENAQALRQAAAEAAQ